MKEVTNGVMNETPSYVSSSMTALQVVCSLECWSEESASYVSLKSFHVSESAATEMLLPPEEQVPSRRWRVCVNGVEWVDDEQGELFTIK